jgi:hypothetical protein
MRGLCTGHAQHPHTNDSSFVCAVQRASDCERKQSWDDMLLVMLLF